MPFINDIKVATAGGTDQTLYTCPVGAEAAVPTLYFNARTGSADLTLKIHRQATGVTVEILEAFPVADDTPYNFPKPIMLQEGDYISFNAATNDIVGVVGVYQSGDAAAASAFVLRGVYSAGATYARLDLTVEAGSTYACLTNGTSGELPSTSANFVLFAGKGDAGNDALGWTGGSYDAGTGVVTFTSTDGLGFTTSDLRGADAVVDTASVAAAGALMDSEVTNLAAVKAFDPTNYSTAAQGALADTALQPSDFASATEIQSGAANKVVTADGIESALDLETQVGTNFTPDWSSFLVADWPMSGNRTLGNPTNVEPGTTRYVFVRGIDGSARTLTFGSYYKGDLPTIDDATSTKWYLLSLVAYSPTHIVVASVVAQS